MTIDRVLFPINNTRVLWFLYVSVFMIGLLIDGRY